MRLTIERMRTMLLVAGILLFVAIVAILGIRKWKNPFNRRDIPTRLGIEIQQEANAVTYTQAHGGHTLFKIHASKVVQLKNDHALLHDVKIELYGADGSRVDRIEGAEFEYDQKTGIAQAVGPVEITLMRPGMAPAIAPSATPDQVAAANPKNPSMAAAAKSASAGEIHVHTSGVTFNQKDGVASTRQHVDFSLTQGSGSSTGATYDSQGGLMVLDSSVVLNTRRGNESVEIHADHAEFERDSDECHFRMATADFRGGHATAAMATLLLRQDGSAAHLDATGGFTMTTATGSHLAAPLAQMDFNERNQPRHGHLEGGITMDMVSDTATPARQRHVHGTAPQANLDFTAEGALHHAHLERGVMLHSEEDRQTMGDSVHLVRNWQSPIADIDFRQDAENHTEPSLIHGTEGVTVTGQSQRGKASVLPSKLTADEVTGIFGSGSVLNALTGTGHASVEDATATGAHEFTSGDRLEAHFTQAPSGVKAGARGGLTGVSDIQSATVDGNAVLVSEPAAKTGEQPEPPLRAWAGHAEYDGNGQWLHLTVNPRIEDGGMQLVAAKIDFSRQSGDAFAHGNVKATWIDNSSSASGATKPAQSSPVALGGSGPAHVVSAEAQLHQATGEATFRGDARLWQQANSVAAPIIVLDRNRQTLVARTASAAEPVRAVLLSAGNAKPGEREQAPDVIRVRGGDLKYSDAERKAVMQSGVVGSVVAETGSATSTSNQVVLVLLPPGNHAGKDGGQAQVDTMSARGHVVVSSEGRRGTGEQLVYTGETGEYVLTGTAAALPRITDPARGTATGEALIFHSRDDSVSIEGGAHRTTTSTTTPK